MLIKQAPKALTHKLSHKYNTIAFFKFCTVIICNTDIGIVYLKLTKIVVLGKVVLNNDMLTIYFHIRNCREPVFKNTLNDLLCLKDYRLFLCENGYLIYLRILVRMTCDFPLRQIGPWSPLRIRWKPPVQSIVSESL